MTRLSQKEDGRQNVQVHTCRGGGDDLSFGESCHMGISEESFAKGNLKPAVQFLAGADQGKSFFGGSPVRKRVCVVCVRPELK